jgi:hypothetical protein
MTEPAPQPEADEPPPILGSWRRLYALLIIELAVITVLAYALGRWAS